jgi:hypothetical protein
MLTMQLFPDYLGLEIDCLSTKFPNSGVFWSRKSLPSPKKIVPLRLSCSFLAYSEELELRLA